MKHNVLSLSIAALFFLLTASLSPAAETNDVPPASSEKAAVAAAEIWLKVIDEGRYAESWTNAGKGFQAEVSAHEWVADGERDRKPLGDLLSRNLKSAELKEKLPGAPSGPYMLMQFDTSFDNMKWALEIVIFVLEKSGEWKAAAYDIKPAVRLKPASVFCPVAGDTNVTKALRPIRKKYNMPAMAAAVVTSEGLKFVGVVGVRKRDTKIAVGLDDLWHLGSDAKIMTSTLIAKLVERGQLKWDSTLGGIFPELTAQMNPEFQKVTLLELLSHHAGLPANIELADYEGDDVQALRLRVVEKELAKKPESAPGTEFAYSNEGYIIAGAIVEKVMRERWESAITEEIFKPLGMTSAGFGGTGTPGQIDQPWPHGEDGEPVPTNGPTMDNPPVMGPAGRVHCSIEDWAKFVQDQLRGARGESALLKPESYQKLQTPPCGGDYALGWMVAERGWGGGKVLNHGGDNTMNFANVWVAPKKDFAILACINQSSGDSDGKAFEASDEAIGAMMKLLKKKAK